MRHKLRSAEIDTFAVEEDEGVPTNQAIVEERCDRVLGKGIELLGESKLKVRDALRSWRCSSACSPWNTPHRPGLPGAFVG